MRTQRGFTMAFVIVALIMVGVAMFVLTEGANTMLFQADTAYLKAVERNLIASGMAWASEQVSGGGSPPTAEAVNLDTAAFGCPDARLVVRILEIRDGKAKVRVETSCHKGRQTLDTGRDFTIAVL